MKENLPYIARSMGATVERLAKQFPALLITGPRQSGKSTLVKHVFKNHTYVTLDQPEYRTMANEDPEYFLGLHQEPVIIDEIQYAPKLFSYLKLRIDEAREHRDAIDGFLKQSSDQPASLADSIADLKAV